MNNWLETLRTKKEDRGLMANLRCYLTESKEHRAYPYLYRLGIPIDSESKSVVAAFYAMHPVEGNLKNFGSTVRQIKETKDKKSNDRQTPTERRFQHLLASEPGRELFARVARLVILAKATGVPVNYLQLQKDMEFWNSKTRQRWAGEFWKSSEQHQDEDAP